MSKVRQAFLSHTQEAMRGLRVWRITDPTAILVADEDPEP
jgi:hypothetical protein